MATDITKNFYNWLKNNGVVFDPIKIDEESEFRGLITNRDISAGEVVMAIPDTLYLFTTKKTHEWCQEHYPTVLHPAIADITRQTLYFSHEFYSGISNYEPYFDMLPRHFDFCPIFFTEKELAQLKGTCVGLWTENIRSDLNTQYLKLLQLEPHINKNLSFDQFLFCFKQLTSRTFALPNDDSALLPMLDMVNHSHAANITYAPSKCGKCFEFTASKDIERGNEISIIYSIKNNTAHFVNYGFLIDAFHYHDAYVQGEVNGFGKINLILTLDGERQLLDVFAFLRRCLVEGKKHLKGAKSEGCDIEATNNIIDLDLEIELLKTLASMCEATTRARTITDDEAYDTLLAELRQERKRNYNKINIVTCLQKETRTLLKVKRLVDFSLRLLKLPNDKALDILRGEKQTPLRIVESYKQQLIDQLELIR